MKYMTESLDDGEIYEANPDKVIADYRSGQLQATGILLSVDVVREIIESSTPEDPIEVPRKGYLVWIENKENKA